MDKDNFLRLMFAYTTSDVYLTSMFKFEIYSTNFREITCSWPYINSVMMLSIFVKLLDGYPWPLINKYDVVMTNINLLFAI